MVLLRSISFLLLLSDFCFRGLFLLVKVLLSLLLILPLLCSIPYYSTKFVQFDTHVDRDARSIRVPAIFLRLARFGGFRRTSPLPLAGRFVLLGRSSQWLVIESITTGTGEAFSATEIEIVPGPALFIDGIVSVFSARTVSGGGWSWSHRYVVAARC